MFLRRILPISVIRTINQQQARMASKTSTDGSSKSTGLYNEPTVVPPSQDKIRQISEKLGLEILPEEIPDFHDIISSSMAGYQTLMKYPEPSLPVKYPRTPGYRPSAEENTHNAWYFKSTINGAAEGKLKGKTVAVKDNIAVAGVPMMNGSKLMEGFTPAFDATVVTRVLDQGAKILGKSACENFCYSGNSFTCASGPVLNPHNTLHSAGGSSSGSAALVALKEVDMAIGGDQGGSIRIPACFCGIVGLKPTWGLVPYTGAGGIEFTNDHLGPMTSTVYDCALLLEAIAGYDDGLDSRQPVNLEVKEYTAALDGNIDKMKIGVVEEGFEGCESDVAKMVEESAQMLSKKGAVVEKVSVPIHRDAHSIWAPLCTEGAYQTMIEGAGAVIGSKGFYPTAMLDFTASKLKTRAKDLSTTMKMVCVIGDYMKTDYNNRFYGIASNLRRTLTQEYNKFLDSYDVLVMPTIKYKAPPLPAPGIKPKDYVREALGMTSNTAPFDGTGHPALTINCGFSEGIPVGMMIVGKHFEETKVLKVAHAFEQLRDAK